jgi:hypothetical protein
MINANELLRRALDELIAQDGTICQEFCTSETWDSPQIIQEIRDFLAAETEAEPMTEEKDWLIEMIRFCEQQIAERKNRELP